MSAWDSAATSGSTKQSGGSGGDLKQPLLGGDQGAQNPRPPANGGLIAPRGGRGGARRTADMTQEAPSVVTNEILHGEGKGLKLMYSANTEEEFASHMAEERERDILRTATNVRLVNEVFTDLGQLVTAQQANVDAIESQVDLLRPAMGARKEGLRRNVIFHLRSLVIAFTLCKVESATERTTAGMDQLDKAAKGQKGCNSCYFNILGALVLLFLVLFVFMFWDEITGSGQGNDDDDDDDNS